MTRTPPARRDPGRRERDHRRPARPEPAMLRGVVVAVLGLLTTLGVTWAADVDKATISAIAVVLAAVIPLLQALWTRLAVTPTDTVVAQQTPAGEVVAGPAAPSPTGTPVDVHPKAVP